ncbi:MAG TPA: DUF2721 domain-containing protein [Thermoanaerobaculia bacterium]
MLPEVARSASEISSVLEVLSAMITPAVLILASGSLILTTSNRLTRVVDRVREMAKEVEELEEKVEPQPHLEEKRTLLFAQLDRSTRRSRILQKSMTRLYIALAMFVATSVAIGIVTLFGVHFAWVPLSLGFIGAGLMFSASVHLIFESRIALQTTYAEMDYIVRNYMSDRRRAPRV